MPKLEKSKANYSYSTKYRHNGDSEESSVANNIRETPEIYEQYEEKEPYDYNTKEESTSPTKWLSKRILESSNKDNSLTDRKYSSHDQNIPNTHRTEGRNLVITKYYHNTNVSDKKRKDINPTKFHSNMKCFSKALANNRYNKSNERITQISENKSLKYDCKQLSNSKSFSDLLVNKKFMKPDEESTNSKSKINYTDSRDEISNMLSK